jgi:polysaccharide biosynthesis/export protein
MNRCIATTILLLVITLPPPVSAQAGSTPSTNYQQPVQDYVLGPDDEFKVEALDAPELSDKSYRIDNSGFVGMALLGRFHVAGMTSAQLENELNRRLKEHVLNPAAVVSITQFRSQPVSVLGSVNAPGAYQIRGSKSLIDVLALAGGIRADAGYKVRLSRRISSGRIPSAKAFDDAGGQYSVVEIPIRSIMSGSSTADDVRVLPHDVVTVPRGEVVYVVGDVQKSGGYVLGENESMSALQALSLAGGLAPTAAPKNTRLLRAQLGQPARQEIALNLKDVLAGKAADVTLRPDDILFIPSNTGKKAALRALEAVIQTGTGVAIWRSSGRY